MQIKMYAPEDAAGGGLGGCCASWRLCITDPTIWLNHVSPHMDARPSRKAPPDAAPADSSAFGSAASAASLPSKVQSDTNHPSPPAGRVVSNHRPPLEASVPSSPLCAAMDPSAASPS